MNDSRGQLRLVKGVEEERYEDPSSLEPDALFRRFAPYVAAIALRLLGRRVDVDDVVQDVFIEAFKGLGRVREPAAIRGWLATITVRVVRRQLRVRRLRTFVGLDDAADYEALVDPGHRPEQRALVAAVYRTLDTLPADQRLAWSLRKIEGEPLAQVATLCGCSLATAKRRIGRASAALEEVFEDDA